SPRGRRLDAERSSGRSVREDRQTEGLPRARHLRSGAAPSRHEDERDDHRGQHRPRGGDLQGRALRRRRGSLRRRGRAREAVLTPTRSTFAGLSTWEIAFWYCLIAVSTAIFIWGVVRLLLKYRRGRGPVEFDRPLTRLRHTAAVVVTHAWIKR